MIEKYVNAEELKRLLSVLVVILGCLIIAGLFASIVVPGLRNANRPATPAPVAPVVGESGWLNPEEFPSQKGSVIPPVDPKTLIEPSKELIDPRERSFRKKLRAMPRDDWTWRRTGRRHDESETAQPCRFRRLEKRPGYDLASSKRSAKAYAGHP